jgi:hypothetical protein
MHFFTATLGAFACAIIGGFCGLLAGLAHVIAVYLLKFFESGPRQLRSSLSPRREALEDSQVLAVLLTVRVVVVRRFTAEHLPQVDAVLRLAVGIFALAMHVGFSPCWVAYLSQVWHCSSTRRAA